MQIKLKISTIKCVLLQVTQLNTRFYFTTSETYFKISFKISACWKCAI